MFGSNDLFGLLYICKFYFDLLVVVVLGIEDVIIIFKIVGVGVLGFIFKIISVDDIVKVVQLILDGDIWLFELISEKIQDVDEEFFELVDKVFSLIFFQYKVLCYMCDGLLNKQIGYNLDIVEVIVKVYVIVIFKKFGINNCIQVVLIVLQLELELLVQ